MTRVELTWHGDRLKAIANIAASQGLMKAGEALLSEAKEQVPVDEGTLRASGMVEQVTPTRVEVSFNTRYAARQHEELSYRHPKGGKAKYLEDPLKQGAARWRAIIQRELTKAMKG